MVDKILEFKESEGKEKKQMYDKEKLNTELKMKDLEGNVRFLKEDVEKLTLERELYLENIEKTKSVQIQMIVDNKNEEKLNVLKHDAATFIRLMVSQFAQQKIKGKKNKKK